MDELARDGQTIRRLSIVGYSLGGLVARYAIGLLFHKGYFDRLEPVNFTTFVTPHLGMLKYNHDTHIYMTNEIRCQNAIDGNTEQSMECYGRKDLVNFWPSTFYC